MNISIEFYTRKVEECKVFYTSYFGFEVKLEAEAFVVLQYGPKKGYDLMFCLPDSPFVQPIFHPEFRGRGAILQFEVPDIVLEYARVRHANIPIVLPLLEEAVNGHHFTIRDPGGLLIDLVQEPLATAGATD